MKKRRLKRLVKEFIVYALLFLMCIGFVIAICYKAEQIDKSMEVNYEEIN